MLKWNWNVVMLGGFLFFLLFLRESMDDSYSEMMSFDEYQSHPSLLLFMLPGMLSARFAHRDGLLHGMLAALVAAPLCMLFVLFEHYSYPRVIDVMVHLIGAAFWCGLGALLYVFGSRIILHHKNHVRRMSSKMPQKKYNESDIGR